MGSRSKGDYRDRLTGALLRREKGARQEFPRPPKVLLIRDRHVIAAKYRRLRPRRKECPSPGAG